MTVMNVKALVVVHRGWPGIASVMFKLEQVCLVGGGMSWLWRNIDNGVNIKF